MGSERITIRSTSGTSRKTGDTLTETLTGSRTITTAELDQYDFIAFNPDGSNRTVTLPAEATCKGVEFYLKNTGSAAAIITVNEDGATAVMTLSIDELALLYCDGTTWHGGAIPETVGAVAPGEITLAEGSILRGNSSGVAAAHVAKTSGQILVGDGTTVASVAVSGDAALSSAGAVTLTAGVLAAGATGRALMAAGFFDAATVLDKFAANSFDATNVDDAFATGSIGEDRLTAAEVTGRAMAVVANANVIGGIPVIHRITIANATADTDVTLTHKTRVLDVWLVKTGANGGAGDLITVKSTAAAITDAIDLTIVTDTLIKRAASIDDANHEIAAGGILRVSAVSATNCACEVYVMGIRVA